MPRAALLLAIGIGLGAALAVYFGAPRRSVSREAVHDTSPQIPGIVSSSAPANRAETNVNIVDALALRPRGTAERAALYAAVARSDARGIETLLIAARALPDRETRAFALDVLLARYAELDPSEAVAAAKELDVPAASLAPLYHAWLKASPSAALASLGGLDVPKKTQVASGVLALVADDDALAARIVAVLPAGTSRGVYASSLAELARTFPAEALARAEKIGDSVERRAAVNRVLSAWAQADPRAVADYLAGLEPEARREAIRGGVWDQISQTAPELAFERADSLPEDVRAVVQSYALQPLAQRDPKAALARLAQMPPGIARDRTLPMIARSYAASDAEGALAWARSLQPSERGVMAAVISGIADKDPARAFDLAAELTSPMERVQALQSIANTAIQRDPASSASLLERVLALPNTSDRQMLAQTVMSNWAARDPAKATDWLLANPGQSPDVVTQTAAMYARSDPARAASYATRLNGDARAAWVRGVASGYAQVDSHAALEWVDQLRGTAEYDEAAVAVVQSTQQPQDFAAAARLLESIGRDDYRRMVATSLASRWASNDPVAAASWASNQHDPSVHTMAVQVVASTWATQDAPAAREWVLSQPAGQARDGALIPLISATARFGAPDASLLGQLSTDQARLGAVQGAAIAMAQRDPDGARAFVDNNVSDSEQRQRVMSVVSQVATTRRLSSPLIGSYPAGLPPIPMVRPGDTPSRQSQVAR